MIRIQYILFLLGLLFLFTHCTQEVDSNSPHNGLTFPQDYKKEERYIKMRDGVRLFTTIYSPKDTTKTYPVIMKRTPYSCAPYGKDTLPSRLHYNQALVASGYIFMVQDVRGRWMSEGVFENTKPPYSKFDSTATDEITDSWDTFQWIADSLPNYSGSIGLYGTSYPGFQSLVGACSNHPDLKAVIAAAPVMNFYFDDFTRYGLFALNYAPVITAFGTYKDAPTDTAWWNDLSPVFGYGENHAQKEDYYHFFQKRLALSNLGDVIDSTNFFWQNIKAHPTYDEYRKKRDWVQYLTDIKCNVMVVGGWNDEQNLYGILHSYQQIEKNSPQTKAQMVMGPWSHGHHARKDSAYYLGNVFYGYNLSKNYIENTEFPYFEKHLKNKSTAPDFKTKLFNTGKREWAYFDQFPQVKDSITFYLSDGEMVNNANDQAEITYVSDPFHPVPFIEDHKFHRMAPKHYFTDDQRFTSTRPDVLTFETSTLEADITVLGEIKALIDFATDHEDADLFVKVIDVYPMDRTPEETDVKGVKMNGYQQLVRCGYIRGRYRDGFEEGKPFSPSEKTTVNVPLLEIYHTFKKGHKIMVQVQSSMFPLFDMNPQNYVEDIYNAQKADFEPATHTVYGSSKITLPVTQ